VRRGLAAGVVALVALAACSDDGDDPEPTTTTTTTVPAETTTTVPLAAPMLDQVPLGVEEVAQLDEPIALAVRPGSPDLYVAEKAGRVRRIEVDEPTSEGDDLDRDLLSTPILDLSDEIVNGREQGLLGLAFSSDGRRMYLDYTRQPDGATVVVEYELGDGTRLDQDSRRELLVVEQPFANHNGGQLVIGPDGYLYVGLGDGGGGGDPDGHGQDPTTLLGSILRIDPEGAVEGGPAYGIPAGNPFADGEDGRPETWLYGVRNPWRFTFDRATGDLWVADVGQDAYEEINRLPATSGFDAGRGANLGWNEMEGTHPYAGGTNPPDGVLPLHEYGRDLGCSITGGYVYRGDAIPALQGTYLYADYCSSGIRGLQIDQGQIIDDRTWDVPVAQTYSFGQDDAGELYVLLADGRLLRLVAG